MLSCVISFDPYTNVGGWYCRYSHTTDEETCPKSQSFVTAEAGIKLWQGCLLVPTCWPVTDLLLTPPKNTAGNNISCGSALLKERRGILCLPHTRFHNVLSFQHLYKPWDRCSNCKQGSCSFFKSYFHREFFIFTTRYIKLDDFTITELEKDEMVQNLLITIKFYKKHVVSH